MKELFFSQKKIGIDFALLVLRAFMGITFLIYAIKKIENFDNYVVLFSDKLDLPLPLIQLFLVTGVEGIGGILLLVGLFTRLITVPLIVTMVGALFLVNINNGFAASSFGVEVPLAYISILVVLFANGAGKLSLDEKLSSSKN